MNQMNLKEEHNIIRESIRAFAEKEIRPVAGKLDENEEFSAELTAKMGELGLFGTTVAEECGGHGLDYLSYIIAVEELARVDGSQAATVAAHNSLGTGPIFYFGSKAQKEKYLPKLCTGKALWAFGLTEPDAGSDSQATRTTAELKDGFWVINGSKTFITNGSAEITAGVTVKAVSGVRGDGKKEFSTILVEAGTPGFTARTMKGKLMWRGSNTSELFFDNCRVPAENLLGHRGDGAKVMLTALDSGRLAIGAMGLGCAQGAFEAALAYSKERKQFGKPLVEFQAMQFQLAEMATDIEAARLLVYNAARLKDADQSFRKEAAMCKYFASQVAERVASLAVEVFGGMGFVRDYPVEKLYRDAKSGKIYEGTSFMQLGVIAKMALDL